MRDYKDESLNRLLDFFNTVSDEAKFATYMAKTQIETTKDTIAKSELMYKQSVSAVRRKLS